LIQPPSNYRYLLETRTVLDNTEEINQLVLNIKLQNIRMVIL